MKVDNKNLSTRMTDMQSEEPDGPGKVKEVAKGSFKAQLARVNREQIRERLDKLLTIVDEQGEKLKQTLDQRDLQEYKKRVQDFLRLIQKEYAETRQTFSWDGRGQVKTYTLIKKVDTSLDILQSLFLQEQADVLEIVRKIDEIRGLILDLYI